MTDASHDSNAIFVHLNAYFEKPQSDESIDTILSEVKYLETQQEDHQKCLKQKEEWIYKWFTALTTLVGAVAIPYLSKNAEWPLGACPTWIVLFILAAGGATILILLIRATSLVELDYPTTGAIFPLDERYKPDIPHAHKKWLIKSKWDCCVSNEKKLNQKAECLERVYRLILIAWFIIIVFAAYVSIVAPRSAKF
jgi:hypothetical protein